MLSPLRPLTRLPSGTPFGCPFRLFPFRSLWIALDRCAFLRFLRGGHITGPPFACSVAFFSGLARRAVVFWGPSFEAFLKGGWLTTIYGRDERQARVPTMSTSLFSLRSLGFGLYGRDAIRVRERFPFQLFPFFSYSAERIRTKPPITRAGRPGWSWYLTHFFQRFERPFYSPA